MLNTDFSVFYDVETNDAGMPTCDLNHLCGIDNSCADTECQAADTFSQAQAYVTVSTC